MQPLTKRMLRNQSIIWLLLLAIDTVIAGKDVGIKDLANITQIIREKEDVNDYQYKPACDKKHAPSNWKIFCRGHILQLVNIYGIYNDSKTFVDKTMKASDDKIIEWFEKIEKKGLLNVDRNLLENGIKKFFGDSGEELETCELTGWNPSPEKIMRIKDKAYRDWALLLNEKWTKLCRKVKKFKDIKRRSLIRVPHEFVVPGERFKEFYYWDTYWIVKGLLVSGLYDNVKKMILNYMDCVDRYDFVPNGGRIYYLKRSQPPMLTPMVYEYYKTTNDLDFIKKKIKYLTMEYKFWFENRCINITIDGNSYSAFQYHADSSVPRPESYLWDLKHSIRVLENHRPFFWKDIASAVESGWDFSSRWFSDKKHLRKIETTLIVPVDLNAIMCWNINLLIYFFKRIGDLKMVEFYREKKIMIEKTMSDLLYNETIGAWFDYDISRRQHNTEFNAAMIAPVFSGCYKKVNSTRLQRAVDFFKANKVFDYPGGIPTTLRNTGQKWDFPNGFSPLQHMFVEGLRKSKDPEMQTLAFEIADKWVKANYKVYKKTGHMYDRLNVNSTIPEPGIGGEYKVQEGFGWTNGVILDFLNTYHDRLTLVEASSGVKDISQIPLNYLLTIVFLPYLTQQFLFWIIFH